MRLSLRGQSGPLLIGSTWRRGDDRVARGWLSCRVWWRERLGSQDAVERRNSDDPDAIDPDGVRSDAIYPDRDCSDSTDPDRDGSDSTDSDRDRSDAIDRDGNGVPNNNCRGNPATSHDNDLQYHDNGWSQSGRGCGSGCGGRSVAGRRIEQHGVGLDRLRDSRGGGPHRRDRLVVAETLREEEHAGARPPTGRILV